MSSSELCNTAWDINIFAQTFIGGTSTEKEEHKVPCTSQKLSATDTCWGREISVLQGSVSGYINRSPGREGLRPRSSGSTPNRLHALFLCTFYVFVCLVLMIFFLCIFLSIFLGSLFWSLLFVFPILLFFDLVFERERKSMKLGGYRDRGDLGGAGGRERIWLKRNIQKFR